MKRITSIIYPLFLGCLFLVAIMSACKMDEWTIPTEVGVKTHAKYNLSLGSYERALSDDFSKDTLADLMGDDNGFTIYDYNPSGNSATQQYLVDYPLQDIPVDLGGYFDKMDFADRLEAINIDQTITIPPMKFPEVQKSYPFPNINKIMEGVSIDSYDFWLEDAELKIPENSLGSPKLTITGVEFTEMEFWSGGIVVKVPDHAGKVLHTSFKISLVDGKGKEITSVSGVNLARDDKFELPLAGKKISKDDMYIKMSGQTLTTDNGAAGRVKFMLSPSLSGVKMKKVTGFTKDLDPIKIDNAVDFNAGFERCEIDDKDASHRSVLSIVSSQLPSDWTGISFNKSLSVHDKNNLFSKSDGDFTDKNEIGEAGATGKYIFNRKLYLRGATLEAGKITVGGNLTIKMQNATITSKSDGSFDPIKISTSASITKLKSLTAEFGGDKFSGDVGYSEPLPSEASRYLKAMKLKPSGVTVEYDSGLPAGNDITLESSSAFFGIGSNSKVETVIKGGKKGKEEIYGTNTTEKDITDIHEIDFSSTMKLPGYDSSNKKLGTLYNIEISDTVATKYTIKISVKPAINWEYMKMKTDDMEMKSDGDGIDTSLDLGSMFGDITDKLGDDEFIKRINIKKIPLYLYAVVPDITPSGASTALFSNLKFVGTFKAKNKDSTSKPIYIVGSEDADGTVHDGTIKTVTKLNPLKKDKSDVVISDISKDGVEEHDISELFNRHEDGSIMMKYDLNIQDKNDSDNTITITKKDLDAYGDSDEGIIIKVHARFVLPMNLVVTKGANNSTDPLVVNMGNLLFDAGDDDMLGRSEATDTSDLDKFLDAASGMGGSYTVSNNYLVYPNGGAPSIDMDTTNKGQNKDLKTVGDNGVIKASLQNGSVSITNEDMRSILKSYPFHPALELKLPVGDIRIPHNANMKVQFNVFAATNGTIKF